MDNRRHVQAVGPVGRRADRRPHPYADVVIEVAAALAKIALPVVVLAWGVAVQANDTVAAAVGGLLVILVTLAAMRSGRLRGKRAEGGP